MTEEEFYKLPPEQQEMILQQMQQTKALRVDYGSMNDPYSQSSGQNRAAPQSSPQQEQSMPQAQPQGGGGGGIDGGQMLKMANQLRSSGSAVPASGAGSALTATEAASFAPVMAPQSLAVGGANAAVPQMGTAIAGNVGSGAVGTAGAGSSGGGMMAAAGPWAALAAGIIANEAWAKDSGRRPEDSGDHAKDMLTGKVLEYDMQALSDKMPGKTGELVEIAGEMGNPEGLWNNIQKLSKPWDWF